MYDNASRLLTSTCINGLLHGITVGNHFDWRYGRDKLTVSLAGGWNLEDDYGYDTYGRLGSVSSGNCTASYAYVANSDLLQSTTFKNNGSTVMTTTRKWNYGFQLASIANVVDGTSTPVTSHAYTYDNVNRRTEAKLEDGSAWEYGYNDRNELTGANRYWYDSRPVSGQQFGYNYDNIGNRTWARFGGDTNGNNLQTISYTANNLNQYTGIVTPGLQDIIGAALGTNSVTVNASPADRHGEYFHRQISVANTNQPVWQGVTVSSGGTTSTGGLVLPANNQTLVYDADGNLTFDGVWNYQWDGENRLISMNMTNITGMSANAQGLVTNRLRLDFAYDYLGRRVEKTVSVWNSTTSGFQTSTANSFVYDGWNLVAILSPQSSLLQSVVWGNDLSGTEDQAGGIGGILMVDFNGTDNCVGFDGNGNITMLVKVSDKSLTARYEYSPYGELLRATGIFAQDNRLQFSTKFCDEESGLVYFGDRYYQPNLGKWINRDKSEEQGGYNLTQFVLNSPVKSIDSLGDMRIDIDDLGFNIHDTVSGKNITYGLDANGDAFGFTGTERVGHEGQAPLKEVQASIRENLPTAKRMQLILDKSASRTFRGNELLAKIGRIRTSAMSTLRALGTAGGGTVIAATAIFTAVSAGSAIADEAWDYARKRKTGQDNAWADLDAIDIAVNIQDASGNAFITDMAVAILVQDE